MSPELCVSLVTASYLGGFVNSIIIISETFTLGFCGDSDINDFFCNLPPLVRLVCDMEASYQAVLYFILTSNIVTLPRFILTSLLSIVVAILKIRSTTGRLKAFSTCGSHLAAVILYYCSILFSYSWPSTSYALEQDKVVLLFYPVVSSMLNPLIYSLRNKDVPVENSSLSSVSL